MAGLDLLHCLHCRGGDERRSAGEEMIKRRAQRIDIRGGTDQHVLAGGLFRRHVARRAQHEAGQGQSAVLVRVLRQSEVGDAGIAGLVDKDVRRFQIAMKDAVLVGIGHSPPNAAHDLHGRPRIERAFARLAREAFALDE